MRSMVEGPKAFAFGIVWSVRPTPTFAARGTFAAR